MSIISGANAVTGAGAVSYQIERSLRFNSADSAYLSRTPASAGNRKTWTLSMWVKRSNLGNKSIFGAGVDGNNLMRILFGNDIITFYDYSSGAYQWLLQTTQQFRDVSGWYHLVFVVDTTQATSSNRVKIYVNGVQVTALGSPTYPSQNYDGRVNYTYSHFIGSSHEASPQYYDGYMADIIFIDGQALDPTSFGEFNSTTGVWQPKAYTGSYGTNGFYLDFADNSSTTALGYDAAGSNDWTPNNFSVTAGAGNDSLVDTPTPYGTDTGVGGEVRGNYCTLNPLDQAGSLSNGNLEISTTSASWTQARGTLGVSSGKWYWETTLVSGTNYMTGISKSTGGSTYPGANADGWGYAGGASGTLYNNGSGSSYGAGYTANDVIGIALNLDAGTLTFYKNGTSQGQAASGLTGTWFPSVAVYASSGTTRWALNAGQRPFAYTAPSGFKALCTQNLPEPTVVDGSQYFTAYLYTADGTSPKSRTGIGFAPDFLWFKDRTTAFSHALYDILRGTNKGLQSNSTAAENSYTLMTAFGSDGFTTSDDGTVGNLLNYSTDAYVTWAWKAGGTGVTNTAGSITSTVSANTTAGFSVITYTGNGSANQTVGHGLGVAPAFGILKDRDTNSNNDQWQIFHTAAGDKYGYFTTAAFAGTAEFYPTSGSSTTVSIARGSPYATTNESGDRYVMYLFAPVESYSAFGSFQGNGSSDGPFIFCNFRPRYVLVKNASTTGDWFVYDTSRNTYNVADSRLKPNLSDAEGTGGSYGPDILSNGFKMRSNFGELNGSGNTIIYAAFAENPFKYALAR